MEYRFYVNRGRINNSEIIKQFEIVEIESREGRLLQEMIPLSYVPTAIFRANIPKRAMLPLARVLYASGHDITVTDSNRDKKIERIFMEK